VTDTSEVERLAQWLERETEYRGPTGYMTNAGFNHFLLKFATALRDIEYDQSTREPERSNKAPGRNS
jgi:hypothetical protein